MLNLNKKNYLFLKLAILITIIILNFNPDKIFAQNYKKQDFTLWVGKLPTEIINGKSFLDKIGFPNSMFKYFVDTDDLYNRRIWQEVKQFKLSKTTPDYQLKYYTGFLINFCNNSCSNQNIKYFLFVDTETSMGWKVYTADYNNSTKRSYFCNSSLIEIINKANDALDCKVFEGEENFIKTEYGYDVAAKYMFSELNVSYKQYNADF